MGHIRLPALPTSKKWREVVGLIGAGAAVEEIADAAAKASSHDLNQASDDPVFRYVARLLVEAPLAARAPDFSGELQRLGVEGGAPASVSALLAAVSNAVDRTAFEAGQSSDLGDLAKSAFIESLGIKMRERLPSLFEPQPADIRSALGRFAVGDRFGELARDFFARLTYRSLDYFLSRELANHTGRDKRFATDADRVAFERALFRHTFEASKIVESFADGWYGKTIWRDQNLTPAAITRFTDYAFKKLRKELGRRELA